MKEQHFFNCCSFFMWYLIIYKTLFIEPVSIDQVCLLYLIY